MTKRSSSRRSSSSRRRTSSRSGSEQTRLNQYIAAAVIIVFLILAGYFLFSGNDPLGLFSGDGGNGSLDPPGMVGSGGAWWQVYFTEPQRTYDPDDMTGTVAGKLIDQINSAQRSIDIAAFEFDLAPVANALRTASERGLEVRWVTDDEYGLEEDENEGEGLFALLERAGVEVKDDARGGLMHNKFWIFDDQTVWTGSTNVTVNGNFRNNNNTIVLDSPDAAAIFKREFDEMWGGQFGPRSPSTLKDQTVTIDGTPVQILFSAEDEVMQHLVRLVDGADDRVRFMAFSFTHDDLGDAVLARARAGVDVRGIFETRASETEYSELTKLYCAGLPVRQDGNPGTFHHKVIIIDEDVVVTGSYNFTESADDSNDENVVVVANRDIAAQYMAEFERRWAEASNPEDIACR